MAATLDDLLKYKDKLEIKNPKNGKVIKTVWVRILGDEDLRDAFRASRIVSAEVRASLRDKNSDRYKDEIGTLGEQTREDLESLIIADKENTFANEAPVVIPREELPEMDEIAVQPDAPTLEEQERLDDEIDALENKFRAGIEDYVQTKLNELKVELAALTDEQILEKAKESYIVIESLRFFMEELQNQQGYRSVYTDEQCKNRGYSSIEAFKNAHTAVKAQIIAAYKNLEIENDDIKK